MAVPLLQLGKSSFLPTMFMKGLIQGVVYGAITTAVLFLCLIPLIMKPIRMKLAKKITAVKVEKNPKVRASQESKMSLKPKEQEKPTITPISENWILKKQDKLELIKPVKTTCLPGVPCLWNY
uniref:SIGLEC family like 1 n=1 Tax=Canis lupus dingo TaxID=286419 RepID=A0A8C0L0F2_CANLU